MAATYVLVHGGGHGGWCYQPVARLLRSHVHQVYAPSLTNEAELAQLPQSHLCTTMYMRWRDVDGLRRKANRRLWDLDTGHDMMITEPGWVAEKLMLPATH
ncbi:hypothetical protein AWC29_25740 [Mycobacterium triplex]|uniref:Alpha/beta hydrolase family protein n=1 Tax=Mycobacterium triplex TaxID=47839 RepID=A0A024K4A0_9MYCO|nr:hypothetical protein [Mycobacterium triplex]ORW99777.1 hypothetical protein AWC29_25740 [Mycobacterium triplex]CDO90422.1 Alpha/beta hydrolase family protein [Mycobacterium triplex]